MTAGGFPSIIDVTPYALHLSPPEYEVKLLRTDLTGCTGQTFGSHA